MNTPNHAIKYIQGRPYEVQQVVADDGSLVWIESGINPDKVFREKRASKHPYSLALTHIICEKIALGQTLTSVCKLPGFPSYNIVCQWRRENPEFNEALEWAYKDRRDLIEEALVLEARELGNTTAALRLRFKIMQWYIDKMSCYKVDKHILQRLLQGYKIPDVTHISVDEVYARSPAQQEKDETRDDLFLTVIIDHKTHKVIWVSPRRRKEALDSFFEIIGPEACKNIKVVTCDQHKGYAESVAQYCPKADLVWDKFHLVQNFNNALNDERKKEWDRYKDKESDDDLLAGKYRYIYLTKSKNRSEKDKQHIDEVMSRNQKIAQMEFIKEHFHKIFEQENAREAQSMLCECYEWAREIKAEALAKYFWSLFDRRELLSYFTHKITSGISEGVNRAIKTLKWVAYGYKDMHYFALKIMQKCGYLNSKHALNWLYNENN